MKALPEKQLRFSKLQRSSIILNQNYSLIRKKLEESKINVAVQVGKVQIVDYARLPGISDQSKNRTMLMGLIFGLAAGLVLAFGLEFLDNTIKTSYDIERKNLTVLGIIPSIGDEEGDKKAKILGFEINTEQLKFSIEFSNFGKLQKFLKFLLYISEYDVILM